MKKQLFLILAMFLIALPISFSVPAFKTFDFTIDSTNSSDTWIDEGAGTTNLATDVLHNQGLGGTGGTQKVRSLNNISFIKDSYVSGTTYYNITFEWQIQGFDGGANSDHVRCYIVNKTWSLTAVTWDNFGEVAGGQNTTDYDGTYDLIKSRSPAAATAAGTRVNFTMTSDILNNATHPYGFLCRRDEGGANNKLRWESGNAATAANKPRIYVWSEAPVVPDTTAPRINGTSNNTAPKYGDFINITLNTSDETGLSFINWTINLTTGKIKNNYTVSGTHFNLTNSTQLNQTRGNVLNLTLYTTDTSGNVAQNSTLITVANTPPVLSSILGGAKSQPNASTVLYLDMDEWNGTYILDKTSNNNDGLIVGANRGNGKLGYGMVFDGVDDYVSVADNAVLDFGSNSYTALFWFNWKGALGDTAKNPHLIGKRGTGNWWRAYIVSDPGILTIEQENNNADLEMSGLTTDRWYHVGIVRDISRSTSYLYVDGVLKDTAVAAGLNLDNAADLTMGLMTAPGTIYFNGTIDEVNLYNIALPAGEIAKHYSKGIGTGNITTTDDLAVSINSSSDADNDVLFTAVDWYKNGILNATTGHPNHNNSVLFMPFNKKDNSNTEDYSIWNNTGTVVGATWTNDSAMGLGAYSFDGVNDFLNISDHNSLDTGSAVTIGLWAKRDVNGVKHVMATKSTTTSPFNGWQLSFETTNLLRFATTLDNVWVSTYSVSTITDSAWHYYTASFNGSLTKVYIDGVDVTDTSQTGSVLGTNSVSMLVGADTTGSNNFNGTIDEVRVYNRSLTASEIRQHYQASKLKGLILNNSETKKNEKWNATVTLYDSVPSTTTSINFSFDIIGNTAPNATHFFNTTVRHTNTNLTLNITSSAFDPDNATDGIDPLRYLFYINTTENGEFVLLANTTNFHVTTNATSDGRWGLKVNVTDLEVITEGGTYTFEMDTDTPILDAFNFTNNTFTNQNLTVLIAVKDNSLPYNNSIRVYKGDNNYHVNHSTTRVGQYINLTNLNLNFTQDGNYTIEINFSDALTDSPDIRDIFDNEKNGLNDAKTKKQETEYVFNDTIKNKSFRMLLRFEDKNEMEINNPSVLNTDAYFNSKGTHINFNLSFTANRNQMIPVYEVNTENTNIDILTNTGIKGHLIWYPYGTDFNGKLYVNGIERAYSVKTTRINSKRVKVSIIPATDISINDVVVFKSESIFGLNVVTAFYNLVIDKTAPLPFQFNISGITNNSFTNRSMLNISINGSDLYTDKATLFVNDAIRANGSYDNISLNFSTNLPDGNYTFKVMLNDTAGNKINFTYFLSTVIDTEIPINTKAINRTTANSTNILDNTDVNLTVENLGDIYLSALNISHNASGGIWINHSINLNGNQSYGLIISQNNLTNGQVVGWKFDAYDLAGNHLDPINTFTVGSSAVSESAGVSGGGGGGGGSLNRCQPLTDAFQQCYYYSLTQNACVKGCPESYSCNKDLQCIQASKPLALNPLSKSMQESTFFQNIWLKLKNGFNNFLGFTKMGFDSTSSLSIQQQDMAVESAENRVNAIEQAKESLNRVPEQIKQHPYMAMSIAGIIAIALAFMQFNMMLFMPPIIFYIIIYYAIIFILWFFRVIN